MAHAGVAAVVLSVLVYAYVLRVEAGDTNPFDYLGYFTNQTSLIASILLLVIGIRGTAGARIPPWLHLARGVATAYLLVVAVVYNVLVPGTGSAPAWVSALLHIVFPALVAIDWLWLARSSTVEEMVHVTYSQQLSRRTDTRAVPSVRRRIEANDTDPGRPTQRSTRRAKASTHDGVPRATARWGSPYGAVGRRRQCT
jgi:hypothetical protein